MSEHQHHPTVLVTGATGFVGRHLVPDLVGRGYPVVAAVRSVEAAEPLRAAHPSLDVRVVGDIHEGTDWSGALGGVAAVVHLAARAHQLEDPADDPLAAFLRVNTEGTRALVEQATEAGVDRFVFISSSGAMASLSDDVLDEASACRPDTPYGESKRRAEEAVRRATEGTQTAHVIVRPTLVYGPGNPGNMERLEKLIGLGVPLPLGGLSNRRSFVYVENLCDAIRACLERPEARNETFVVSDTDVLSTSELIRLIGRARGRRVRLVPVPKSVLALLGRVGDVGGRFTGRSLPVNSAVVEKLTGSLPVSNAKIRRCLNWHPPFTTEQGIRATFAS